MNKPLNRSDTIADEFLGAKLGEPLRIPHSKIDPNPDQPRDPKHMDKESLVLLSQDIEENDQHKPVVVFRRPEPQFKGRFMLVGGERRWTSIGMICERQKKDWPVLAFIIGIKDAKHLFEKSFLDNLGHENYNVIEEARGFARLIRDGWTPERIAVVVQKSVGWVEDRIQIDSLPEAVKDLMYLSRKDGGLPTGVAITLANMPKSQDAMKVEIAREVVARALSGVESQFLITLRTGVTYSRQKESKNPNAQVWRRYRMFRGFLQHTKSRADWIRQFGNLDGIYIDGETRTQNRGNDARELREIIEQLTTTYLAMDVEPEKLVANLTKLFAEKKIGTKK